MHIAGLGLVMTMKSSRDTLDQALVFIRARLMTKMRHLRIRYSKNLSWLHAVYDSFESQCRNQYNDWLMLRAGLSYDLLNTANYDAALLIANTAKSEFENTSARSYVSWNREMDAIFC